MKAWENTDVARRNDPESQRLQVLMNDVDVEGMKFEDLMKKRWQSPVRKVGDRTN